jgi:hypothetical protein
MSEKEEEKSTKSKKSSVAVRIARILLKTLMLLVLLAVVLLISLNVYLASNETKIFSHISLLNDGGVSFQSAKIRVFRDFPKATISVENFSMRDAQFDRHQKPIVDLKKLVLTASLQEIWSRQVELKSFELWDGNITIFKDENGFSNLRSFLGEKTGNGEAREEEFIHFLTDNLNFKLHNISLHYTDDIKTTAIHGTVNEISAAMHRKDKGLACTVDMDVAMDEMTFKKEKGAFLKDSKISGQVDLDISDGNISFAPFKLNINDEVFLFSGNIDPSKQTATNLVLENEQTKWDETIPLLTPILQGKIAQYRVMGPFYSKTTISSRFLPGEQPLVNIDFRFEEENQAQVRQFLFEQVTLNGHFVNRIYDAEKREIKGPKSFSIMLNGVNAVYDRFYLKSDHALITKVEGAGARLVTKANINGAPADISRFLKNDKFFFKRGSFDLTATVDGPLNNFTQLALDSEAGLVLKDFSVTYRPSNTAFPFRRLELYKKRGDADFTIVSSTFKNGNDFRIDGGVTNMNALLFSIYGRASSDVNFVADKLGWTDFLNIFGENGYLDDGRTRKKDNTAKKRSMKETIRGIQYQFQPKISIAVDTLEYYDALELHHFRTGVHFADANTLVLENTSFNYGKGSVSLHGSMDIKEPGITPFELELHGKRLNLATLLPPFDYLNIKILANMDDLPEDMDIDIVHKGILDDETGLIPRTSTGQILFNLDNGETLRGKINYSPGSKDAKMVNGKKMLGGSLNTQLSLEGDPALFNEFLKNNRFFFSNGRFETQFDYNGDVTDFRQLLSHSNAVFTLNNSDVYYKLGDVSFPLTHVKLNLKNDHADFDAYMKSDKVSQEIKLVGSIENLSEVVIGKTGKQVKTNVSLTSPSIHWSEFLGLFTTKKDSTKILTLKKTTRGIMDAFSPTVCVYLDTFVYSSKLMLHSVQTGISLADSTTIRLDETGFRFHDGKVQLHGKANLGIEGATPFEAHFVADSLDVAKLLEGLDYLDIPSFEHIEKLSGRTNMKLDWAGVIKQGGKGIISTANDGQLDFQLTDIVIKGFEPLDQLAAKIGMKKRFAEVSFAPIENRLTFKGSDIGIPLMEIQSNAINMFIEGTYSYGDNTNIWVTIPFYNFKSSNRSIIPKKRGYEAARAKIFVEVTTGEKGENKFKFHLRKKKFYKQRGIPEQYRKDIRKFRQLRKENKKNN